ncbi:hypothetical protein L7F22_034188 [Adiantum nelumboides]|nr:hypothetical protein [Adiantum nelumboides]
MSSIKLHQVVRLREALRKWRNMAHKSKSFSRASSGSGLFRHGVVASSPRVPVGHLAVYVGPERERFVIKTSLLSHPLFKALLRKAEEEVGFHYQGGLIIPCEVSAFERLLHLMQGKHVIHNMPILMMRMFHLHLMQGKHVIHNMPILMMRMFHPDEHFDLSEDANGSRPHGFQGLLQELLRLHIKEISSHLSSRCLPDSRLPLTEGCGLQQPICG